MFELYDTVVLLEDDPEAGVKAGTEGTVVYIQGDGKPTPSSSSTKTAIRSKKPC